MVTAWCSTFSSLAGRPTGTRLCRNDPSSSWSGGWLNGRSSTTEETGGLWYTACKFNTHTDAKVKHVEIDLMIKNTSTFKTKSHIHANACTRKMIYAIYGICRLIHFSLSGRPFILYFPSLICQIYRWSELSIYLTPGTSESQTYTARG